MVIVITLVVIGLLSGIVTGLSPCILPVLPVVLTTSAAGPVIDPSISVDSRESRSRPYFVIAGLVTSFAVFTLLGSALLAALGLPQDFLRTIGIVSMIAVGVGFLVPAVSHWLERPFSRLPRVDPKRQGSAFLFGAVFGLVFVPCAGPVLATITVVAASKSIGWQLVVLTFSFSLGVALPLLAFALAGQRMTARVAALRTRLPIIRRVTGVVLIATALAVAFNVTDALQRNVPGYVSALQKTLEGNATAKNALDRVSGRSPDQRSALGSSMSFDDCSTDPSHLHNCGPAPAFAGIDAWLNTPGNKPLSVASLRGRVVLVDFWTYSCINCQRTLPYIEAWDKAYRKMGLTVIGVHTPEFAFEHVVSNVKSQSAALGVQYPVAVDNNYKTWNAFNQQYWPAHYLIDGSGIVRQVHYGEGEYATTEALIRTLLKQRGHATLPATTSVSGLSVTTRTTPETYLGSDRGQSYVNTSISPGRASTYVMPTSVPDDAVGLGGTWTVGPQHIDAGAKAALKLNFIAGHVYLVLGGRGTVTVDVPGEATHAIRVGGAPTLYELWQGAPTRSMLTLHFSPAVSAYSFTFG
jgi:cytochrome c biogenesis protein CcdA/thiol-disulfide isomerase/thioredoxin